MTARLFGPEEALINGYATEIADDPDERAVALAASLAAKPNGAAGKTRSLANASLRSATQVADREGHEIFMNSWFSPEGQRAIHALADRLSGHAS